MFQQGHSALLTIRDSNWPRRSLNAIGSLVQKEDKRCVGASTTCFGRFFEEGGEQSNFAH